MRERHGDLKRQRRAENTMAVSDNPECDFMLWQKPSAEKCPQCGSAYMLEKGKQAGYVENKEDY